MGPSNYTWPLCLVGFLHRSHKSLLSQSTRKILWSILKKFCDQPQPPNFLRLALLPFLTILKLSHNGMQACTLVGCEQPPLLPANIGVEQECVLAPVIFNVFLTAATLPPLPWRMAMSQSTSLSGSLFNFRRLQTKTKKLLVNS